MRGPLARPRVPAMVSRSERFDALVLEAVERIEHRLGRDLSQIEVAVEDVPPSDPAPWEGRAPLGRSFPVEGRHPARAVIYRRPVEARAIDEDDLAELVVEVTAEQFASLLGLNPDDLQDES